MTMKHGLHMAKGGGETSYANNSWLQRKALLETTPMLDKAVREVCMALSHPTMIDRLCDLGCSSGENTLLFVSKVVETICGLRRHKLGAGVELQFFLNDLPGNDFNHLFLSLERFKESIAVGHEGETLPPRFYIAGLPNSYYNRLFPSRSFHLFHSSYSLHWRSKLPDGLEDDSNEGNISIAKSTPPHVVKMYQEQFQKDLLLFLKLRHEELVSGRQMLLTFLGRKNEDPYSGDLNHVYGLLAESIQFLVEKKAKLDSFNVPIYGPSVDEVKTVIKQSQLFNINRIKLFESNWDPYDYSKSGCVLDPLQSGMNVAKCMRAVMGPIFASHFGESVLDILFDKYAHGVAEHLEREKTKYSVIVMSLKRR